MNDTIRDDETFSFPRCDSLSTRLTGFTRLLRSFYPINLVNPNPDEPEPKSFLDRTFGKIYKMFKNYFNPVNLVNLV